MPKPSTSASIGNLAGRDPVPHAPVRSGPASARASWPARTTPCSSRASSGRPAACRGRPGCSTPARPRAPRRPRRRHRASTSPGPARSGTRSAPRGRSLQSRNHWTPPRPPPGRPRSARTPAPLSTTTVRTSPAPRPCDSARLRPPVPRHRRGPRSGPAATHVTDVDFFEARRLALQRRRCPASSESPRSPRPARARATRLQRGVVGVDQLDRQLGGGSEGMVAAGEGQGQQERPGAEVVERLGQDQAALVQERDVAGDPLDLGDLVARQQHRPAPRRRGRPCFRGTRGAPAGRAPRSARRGSTARAPRPAPGPARPWPASPSRGAGSSGRGQVEALDNAAIALLVGAGPRPGSGWNPAANQPISATVIQS